MSCIVYCCHPTFPAQDVVLNALASSIFLLLAVSIQWFNEALALVPPFSLNGQGHELQHEPASAGAKCEDRGVLSRFARAG